MKPKNFKQIIIDMKYIHRIMVFKQVCFQWMEEC